MQQVHDRLGNREVPRRHQRHDTVAGRFPNRQFSKGGDIVDAGIGARIRQHDKPVIHIETDTIRHRCMFLKIP